MVLDILETGDWRHSELPGGSRGRALKKFSKIQVSATKIAFFPKTIKYLGAILPIHQRGILQHFHNFCFGVNR